MSNRVTAQFSLVPASDRFVEIIIDAVDGIAAIEGLSVSTDAVSSALEGSGTAVTTALSQSFVRTAKTGAHVVQPLLVASGATNAISPLDLSGFMAPISSGVTAYAQFAAFGVSDEARSEAVAFLNLLGLSTNSKPLVNRVDGDAHLVIAALVFLVERLGASSGLATIQATLVANLPAAEKFA